MTLKKYKRYITLLTLLLALFFIIKQKHHIEKITNLILYSEEITQPPNKNIKR